MRYCICIIALIVVSGVFADANQTDWSGGPGTQGPVLTWGSDYWESDNIEWSSSGEFYMSGTPLFHDTFNRYCPDDWGTPNIGSTYYYLNPGSAQFSVTADVGYLDDTSQHLEPWAFSDFSESTNSYTFSFSWKYDAGVHSGVRLYYNDTPVIGIRQDEYENKLRFFDGTVWINIGDRDPGVWKDYEIVVNGDSADVYVDGTLVLQTAILSSNVNKIGFGANGLGTPSDSWFEDVIVGVPVNTLFSDSFNRYCPDDWGTPNIGDTYSYLNPGSADFNITTGIGYLDDTSQHLEPWAYSTFSESSDFYTLSFSWKYDAGVHSGVMLYNNDTNVIGIRQDEYADQLRFFDGSTWINIEDRDPGVWKDYEVFVSGDSADVYVDGILVLQTAISSSHVNKIGFGANGLGTPSDSWFDDVHVYSPGLLTSSILNLNITGIVWGTIEYIGTEPPGTEISVRVRASSDFNNMGLWSSWIVSGDSLKDYCGASVQYFQYQVLLTTNQSWNSSVFEHIEIEYNPVGIAEPHTESGVTTLAPLQNPSFGHIVMELGIPETEQIQLDIYDVSGRIVCTPVNGELCPGVHEIVLQDLVPGVYMVRLVTNGASLIRRVLLL